jgi:hypothetical protein
MVEHEIEHEDDDNRRGDGRSDELEVGRRRVEEVGAAAGSNPTESDIATMRRLLLPAKAFSA